VPLARKGAATTSVSPPQRWCTQHRTPGVMTCSLPFQPLRAERRMPPARPWRLTRVLFYFAHGAADALAHPAFRAPSLGVARMGQAPGAPAQDTGGYRAPPRRHNNRGDGAWFLLPPPCGEGRPSEAEVGVGVTTRTSPPPGALFASLATRHPPHKGEG